MKKLFSLFIFLCGCLGAFAERVNTDAEVYEAPGRQTLGQLYKGSGFYISEQKDGWAKIISIVHAPIAGFDEYTLTLPKKTILYDAVGQTTGKLYGKLKLPRQYNYDDKEVVFELVGYIRASQIDTNWIPERSITRLIDSAGSKITQDDLQAELDKYRFYMPTEDSGFRAFQMDDVPGLDVGNKMERLKLVFFENRLVAIFHKNPVRLKSKEVIMIDGHQNLIYLRDLDAEEKRLFGQLFLKD